MTWSEVDNPAVEAASALNGGLEPLLGPTSIAVVGASDRTESQRLAIENASRGNARVYLVNPSRDAVLGIPCYPSLGELPERPEVALVVVGHQHAVRAVAAVAAAGVSTVIVPGLGNEAGVEGAAAAAAIATIAAETGTAVLGPNCMGAAVPAKSCCWIGTVPRTFVPGRVTVITQSGSVGEALLAVGPRIGFRGVISSGAEVVRDIADLFAMLAEDEETLAVGGFVEAIRRPPAFARALERLAAAEKPVVCLKVGRSQAGARAALAHSGAMVGSTDGFTALLSRYGVIEVDDFPEFVEVLEILGRARRPTGPRIAAISESGGEGALLADHSDAAGLPFAPLPSHVATQLRSEFPNFRLPGNPVDAWAIDAVERVFPRVLELLARSGHYDIVVAQLDHSQFRGPWEQGWVELIVRSLAAAVEGTKVFPAVTTVLTTDPWPGLAALTRELDVPLLRGSGAALRALAAVAAWRPRKAQPIERWAPIDLSDLLPAGGRLPEYESGRALERYGVKFAPFCRALSPEEAALAAAGIGLPVAVKLDGPAHKSAIGGVILGLATMDAVAEAAERLGGRVLVARQLPPGPEAFCGLVRDPSYGPLIVVGIGGTAVELQSPSIALAPINYAAACDLINEAPTLAAVATPAARDALANTLVALSRLAHDHPQVVEVDINPLILRSDGADAVDALIVLGQGEDS